MRIPTGPRFGNEVAQRVQTPTPSARTLDGGIGAAVERVGAIATNAAFTGMEDEARAQRGRAVITREIDAALHGVDALIAPGLPIPAPPIGATGEPKTVLTCWADERSMLEPELLDNVAKRMRERGTVLNYFVSGNGWPWVKMGTEAQATRACQRLESIVVDGGRARLHC